MTGADFGTPRRWLHPGPAGVHRQLPGEELAGHRTGGKRPDRLGLQRAESHQRESDFLDADRCQSDRGGGDGATSRYHVAWLHPAQLESTASYQAKNLQGIGLGDNDLTGWDFSGQNLTNADCLDTDDANLTGPISPTRLCVARR